MHRVMLTALLLFAVSVLCGHHLLFEALLPDEYDVIGSIPFILCRLVTVRAMFINVESVAVPPATHHLFPSFFSPLFSSVLHYQFVECPPMFVE